MKRSAKITLGLVAGMALAFTSGCRSQRRDCVDANNRILNDENCVMAERERQTGGMGFRGYHWLYGGSSGGHLGDAVFGGSATPARGVSSFTSVNSPSGTGSTSRGGFGSTGSSGGSGGSGGE